MEQSSSVPNEEKTTSKFSPQTVDELNKGGTKRAASDDDVEARQQQLRERKEARARENDEGSSANLHQLGIARQSFHKDVTVLAPEDLLNEQGQVMNPFGRNVAIPIPMPNGNFMMAMRMEDESAASATRKLYDDLQRQRNPDDEVRSFWRTTSMIPAMMSNFVPKQPKNAEEKKKRRQEETLRLIDLAGQKLHARTASAPGQVLSTTGDTSQHFVQVDSRTMNRVVAHEKPARQDRCGNCNRPGHHVLNCIKVDSSNFVPGCGNCNHRVHNTDVCPKLPTDIETRNDLLMNIYVKHRENLPPLKATIWHWGKECHKIGINGVGDRYPLRPSQVHQWISNGNKDTWMTFDYDNHGFPPMGPDISVIAPLGPGIISDVNGNELYKLLPKDCLAL